MEQIQSHLTNLGYNGSSQSPEICVQAFTEGPPNMIFVDIVSWLSSQLAALCDLESHVSPVDMDDIDVKALGFLVEVSSLLKELGCPIKKLTRGHINDRLIHPDAKMLLIMYLCTELQAAKILSHKKPKKKDKHMQIELAESKTAKELKEMLISLRFSKPPDTITPQQLFCEVEKKLRMLSHPANPKDLVGELLFSGYLTEKQWFQLEYLFKEMHLEYKTRRNLLLTRLDVTVQSFLWADRLKGKAEEVMNIYNAKKSGLCVEPSVKISHILAAKADLAIIEKTSSASVRKNTKSSVNKVIIGSVPDRGGRPEEQQPPPPEVPSWQKSDNSRGGMKQPVQQPQSKYQTSGFTQSYNDENCNPRSRTENQYKSDSANATRGNYRGGYNNVPVYQPVEYCGQFGNPQFGFGGYSLGPAGDNFQQFGIHEGLNQYLPRATRGSGPGPRQRGGFNDRGSNQSRGRSRGRGRW